VTFSFFCCEEGENNDLGVPAKVSPRQQMNISLHQLLVRWGVGFGQALINAGSSSVLNGPLPQSLTLNGWASRASD
jgi:hypothetical protein